MLTSEGGAHRVYDAGDIVFKKIAGHRLVLDGKNRAWEITEPFLQLRGKPDVTLMRVPAHSAFWFGWYAQFPRTLLIK
ncbi:MAG: hypothetical protein GY940_15610 [bacterium]|nr:hypothetical protein [bacterium]